MGRVELEHGVISIRFVMLSGPTSRRARALSGGVQGRDGGRLKVPGERREAVTNQKRFVDFSHRELQQQRSLVT